MPYKSAIEWTDATWNPVTGCTKVSPGCAHCYAEAITLRFKRGGPFLPGKTTIKIHWDRLQYPKQWREPRMIFVNSMSDLFHEEVPLDFIDAVFQVMRETPQHIFQVLTKRPERMLEYSQSHVIGSVRWPANVWAGVSVENQYWAERRTPLLKQVPAAIRFLSCEPLLKPLKLDLSGIHWVIVGGESGLRARPMAESWVRAIREQCQVAGVAFFFKQWGGRTHNERGRVLDGKTWNQLPNNAGRSLQTALL
jgi:protein gp37